MKKKLLIWSLITFAAFSLVAGVGCAKQESPPKAQEQKEETPKQAEQETPKETAEQKEMVFVSSADKPEACASCHVNKNSLNAIAKGIKGHPQVQANTVAECATCHKKDGYPPLYKIIHKGHYEGQDNAFVKSFNGSCVNCHKEAQGGEIFIPGLTVAGTKPVTIEVAQVDKAPNGCLDCHQGEYSLPNTIKKISGHPAVDFEDFNKCYNCHGNSAPQLGKVLHNGHLGSETFKTYGNSCLNCHKPVGEGKVVVKGKK